MRCLFPFLASLSLPALMAACGLAWTGASDWNTQWNLTVVHADGTPYAGAVIHLSPGSSDSFLTTDAQGMARLVDSSGTMSGRELLDVNGCPVALLARDDYGTPARWSLLVDDSLERLCRERVRFRVEGAASAALSWRVPQDLRFESAHGSRWQRARGDSTRLDAQGRGSLSFPGLLQPFREAVPLTLVLDGISYREGWTVRASDTTLLFQGPVPGGRFESWPGCLRSERDSLCWDRWDRRLRHWRRAGPQAPWDSTTNCDLQGFAYDAASPTGSLWTYEGLDAFRSPACGGGAVHWDLRIVLGNDSLAWLDTAQGRGLLLRRR